MVQFATRSGPEGKAGSGLLKRRVVSPMVVRLAGVRKERGEVCGGREKRWDCEDAMTFGRYEEDGSDPCDMEVVLNALQQRRSFEISFNI